MTMRSYSSLLVMENIFDFVPNTNADITNFAEGLFNPRVSVVEDDCETTLGQVVPVNYELEGEVELATGLTVSKDRIEQLLFKGVYFLQTRTLSTCISDGGVCKKCYEASHQDSPPVSVGDILVVQPWYPVATTVVSAVSGQSAYQLNVDPSRYSKVIVYIQGVIQDPSTYAISGTTFTLTNPVAENTHITIKFSVLNRAPFLVWLAKTYSGSLLGLKDLPSPSLPLRPKLLSSLVPANRLEYLVNYTQSLPNIPPDFKTYGGQIKHVLEKALYMIAIQSIFANVSN